MGGYLGTPQRMLKKRINNVEFVIHRVADISNRDDPDVSFAYFFCGSMGASLDAKSDPAKGTAERGRQKAQIEYHEPHWRDCYDLWAKSLDGLDYNKLDVWDYGERIADPTVCGAIGGKKYSILLSADEIDITLKGDTVGAHSTIRPGDSCKKWLNEQIKKVGVAERNVIRAIKSRDLFLIAPDDDD